jgi:hypothetical protein
MLASADEVLGALRSVGWKARRGIRALLTDDYQHEFCAALLISAATTCGWEI